MSGLWRAAHLGTGLTIAALLHLAGGGERRCERGADVYVSGCPLVLGPCISNSNTSSKCVCGHAYAYCQRQCRMCRR